MGDSSGNQIVLLFPWKRCCDRSPTSETVTRGCLVSLVSDKAQLGLQTGLHGAHTTSQPLPQRPRGLPMETRSLRLGLIRNALGVFMGEEVATSCSQMNEMRPSEATPVDPHAAPTMLSLDSSRKPHALQHCANWAVKAESF